MHIVGFFGVLLIFIFGYACGTINDEKAIKRRWIIENKPFCMQSSAIVLDQSYTIKRCWKTVEIKENNGN